MEGLKNRFRKEAVATARVLDAIAVVRLEREGSMAPTFKSVGGAHRIQLD